ncbi:MAG: phage tail terminator protein [Candidatus Heimdallarchaeaceae archaeon]
MIYNLAQHLIVNLPTINFVVNGFSPDSNQDEVMISETGGEPQHWYNRTDWTVQILSRGKNVSIAKSNIDSVYNLLKNKIGLLLPKVTVEGIVYPAIQTYQISPIQTPGYLGTNEENMEMFSFNLIIITS